MLGLLYLLLLLCVVIIYYIFYTSISMVIQHFMSTVCRQITSFAIINIVFNQQITVFFVCFLQHISKVCYIDIGFSTYVFKNTYLYNGKCLGRIEFEENSNVKKITSEFSIIVWAIKLHEHVWSSVFTTISKLSVGRHRHCSSTA